MYQSFELHNYRCSQDLTLSELERVNLIAGKNKSILEPRCIADFFYEPNVLVFCDGPVHDAPMQRRIDERLRRELLVRGWRVVVIRWDEGIETQVESHPDIFRG